MRGVDWLLVLRLSLLKDACLVLLLRIRSAYLEILGFAMGGAY